MVIPHRDKRRQYFGPINIYQKFHFFFLFLMWGCHPIGGFKLASQLLLRRSSRKNHCSVYQFQNRMKFSITSQFPMTSPFLHTHKHSLLCTFHTPNTIRWRPQISIDIVSLIHCCLVVIVICLPVSSSLTFHLCVCVVKLEVIATLSSALQCLFNFNIREFFSLFFITLSHSTLCITVATFSLFNQEKSKEWNGEQKRRMLQNLRHLHILYDTHVQRTLHIQLQRNRNWNRNGNRNVFLYDNCIHPLQVLP